MKGVGEILPKFVHCHVCLLVNAKWTRKTDRLV